MRKFISLLPIILTLFMASYGLFDARVFAFIQGHGQLSMILGALFVVSETLAGIPAIKSNSIAQAIFDFALVVLEKVLHKEPAAKP